VKETGTVEIKYQTVGLADLEKAALAITGVNAALQLAQAGAAAFQGAFEKARAALKGIIAEGAEFERYNTRFSVLLGSMSAAKTRMEEIDRVVSRSTFMDDMVAQAAQILELHNTYSERSLQIVSDAATATGTDITETAQAVGMAMEGMTRGLRQYGISTVDIVKQMGHEVRTETEQDAADLGEAVFTLMASRTKGASEIALTTYDGMLAQFAIKWDEFKEKIAQAGPLDALKGIFSAILTTINQMTNSGAVENTAQVFGKAIGTVLWNVAWQLNEIAISIGDVADFFASLKTSRGVAEYGLGLIAPGQAHDISEKLLGPKPPGLGDAGRMNRENLRAGWATYALGPQWQPPGAVQSDNSFGAWLAGQGSRTGGSSGGGAGAPWYTPAPYWVGGQQAGPQTYGQYMGSGEGESAPGAPWSGGEESVWMMDLEEFGEAKKSWQEEESASEAAWLSVKEAAWGGFYNSITRRAQKWRDLTKMTLRDITGAMGDAMKAGLAAFVENKSKEWFLEGMSEAAAAVKAFPNAALMASHGLASVKYFALAGAAGAVGAGIGSSGGAGERTSSPTYEPIGSESNGGGTRSVSRTVGVKTQSLNVTVNIIHNDAAVYGIDGLRELIKREILPAVDEAIEMGAIG
jgi:hypothetical protein